MRCLLGNVLVNWTLCGVLLSIFLVGPVYGQTQSTVDPTYPGTQDDIDAYHLQQQFQHTHDDINALFLAGGAPALVARCTRRCGSTWVATW